MAPLSIPVLVVLVAVLIATVTDLRSFKIHNLLTLPLLVSGLAYHGLTGGVTGLTDSVLGALFGFGVLLLGYLLGGIGGGDVKLLAGVGAWLGMPVTFLVFLAASLAAGVYSLVVIVANGRLRETWVNIQILWHRAAVVGRHLASEDRVEEAVQKTDRRGRLVPFGAMVGLGLIVLLAIARYQMAP